MASFLEVSARLTKPCIHLKHTGDLLAGVWGGPAPCKKPRGAYEHLITLDTRCMLPEQAIAPGLMSVFTNTGDHETGAVVFQESAELELPPRGDGGLFAHRAESLPPPDADPALDNGVYIDLWQTNCPLYTNEAVATVGGWHFPWPDGDWEELRASTFLLWTIEDAEPWVEVWRTKKGFEVYQRITLTVQRSPKESRS